MPKPTYENFTDKDLNDLYGDIGRTFKTHKQAEEYAKTKQRARITAIWDGTYCREIVAYLVSIDPPADKPKGRYTGKVRSEIEVR